MVSVAPLRQLFPEKADNTQVPVRDLSEDNNKHWLYYSRWPRKRDYRQGAPSTLPPLQDNAASDNTPRPADDSHAQGGVFCLRLVKKT